jgi:hypothetical protein
VTPSAFFQYGRQRIIFKFFNMVLKTFECGANFRNFTNGLPAR